MSVIIWNFDSKVIIRDIPSFIDGISFRLDLCYYRNNDYTHTTKSFDTFLVNSRDQIGTIHMSLKYRVYQKDTWNEAPTNKISPRLFVQQSTWDIFIKYYIFTLDNSYTDCTSYLENKITPKFDLDPNRLRIKLRNYSQTTSNRSKYLKLTENIKNQKNRISIYYYSF